MSDSLDDELYGEPPDLSADHATDTYAQDQEMLEVVHILETEVDEVEDAVGVHITLFDLYTEMENMHEAGQSLVQASRLIEEDNHPELAFFLYNQLELFAQLNPEAQSAYERLGDMIATDEGVFHPNSAHLEQRKLAMQDLIPEILLAQHLMRSENISPSEFHLIIQDLCWFGGKEQKTPRSCLFVLSDRELPHEAKAIEFLSHDSSDPYIDLNLIEPDPDLLEALPLESCIRRAACVFGEVGGEPLVAVLNPFNLRLRDDVARRLECDPHFFITSASGYANYLEHQREATEEETV